MHGLILLGLTQSLGQYKPEELLSWASLKQHSQISLLLLLSQFERIS